MAFRGHFQAAADQESSEHILRAMNTQFNNQAISDLELKVGNRTFYVHKFALSLISDVFRTMCSKRWEGDRSVLQIQECEECIPVFEDFLRYLYSGQIGIDESTALPILMLADKYNVQPLKRLAEDFMTGAVNHGSITGALRWFAYAQVSGHSALQFSCVDAVISKMDEVIASENFLELEIGFLVALLGRDDLVVFWEKALYDAVIRWIDTQTQVTHDEILLLMKLIRFSMMLPDQLIEIETSQFFVRHQVIMNPIINNAHRFRSLAIDVYDVPTFSDAIFRPRNYTHRHWCHYMTIETNGDTFFQDSIGVQCVNHPVVSVTDQFWQIKVIGEKRLSGNLNFSKPTMLPNLTYIMPSMGSSAVKAIPLTLTITPLRPIVQEVAVDISLYQVKRDRLSRFLCGKTLKLFSSDCPGDHDDNVALKAGFSGASSLQSFPIPKFSQFPNNFLVDVKFQQMQMFDKPEVTLRYNFVSQDFDHPAEIPCFKLNGPRRSTNSIRVALVFKPRFIPVVTREEDEPNRTDQEPCQVPKSCDNGCSGEGTERCHED